MGALAERFSATPLAKLLEDPKVKALMDEPSQAAEAEERKKRLSAMGIDSDSVPWPGAVRLALFIERDPELDADAIGVMLCADYGSKADEAAKMADGIIARLERESGRGTEQVDIGGGRRATVIPLPKEDEDLGGGQRRPAVNPLDGIGQVAATPDSLFYLRDGSRFWLASSVASLEDALAAAEGRGETLSSVEDWQGASAQLGGTDVQAIFFTAPLQPLVRPLLAGPMGPMQPLIQKLFGDIRAWGFGLDVGGGRGMIELSSTVFVPGEKMGLVSLVSDGVEVDSPPAMCGDDAVSYQRLNVRFDGIMKLLEDALAALPDMQAEQIAPLLEQWGPGMRKAFGAIGPTMWSFTNPVPGSEGGTRSVTVMRCSDERAATALVALAAPSAGLMPRDFQGGQIYSGEGVPIAIGLGGSAVLYGDLAAVEQVMRASTDASARSLAENAVYRRAAASVPPGPVSGWGYVDAVRSFDLNRKAMLAEDGLIGRMDGAMDDREAVTDMLPVQLPPSIRDALQDVDAALLARYIGPIVYEMRPSDRGLAIRAWWLPPASE
ncbi:MAG: hypothetical protein FGM37_07715 [Phycisphaerales bacterium]|nr:hypothetical protein [Phycisphaerales bacterium]